MRNSSTELVHWLVEEWNSRLAQTVESMTGERPGTAWSERGELTPLETPAANAILWWEQPFSIEPEAPVWVAAPRETWLGIGMLTLRAAGIEQPEEADLHNTFIEVLGESLCGLAQAIAGRLGCEVNCENGREIAQPPHACSLFDVELALPETLPPLSIAFDSALLAKVASHPGPEEQPRPDGAKSAASKTLDLLMEVELPVSVSFGRAEMPLKDVLKLATGSIVELNRTVAEPVEVIVNNCVIARGEVVVVEGNYGVRILEIASRRDRLRTLR